MPLTDRERLVREQARPRIVALHLAMRPLRSVVSFMNTGAHPDDETSAMLAALGFRDGLDLSFACANRGEGGQNDIGTESQATLGTLRTAEMEAAAAALNLRLYWLSQTPDDSVFDFGFSKSGEETLLRWQHTRTLKRFTTIVRRERPDIICPTFLDIPGQHGHHRAMTALAFEVMNKAADPDYKIEGTTVWQVKKLYLPAWGGGGYAYDDEEPPPSATLTVQATGCDSLTGWTWENMGQHSRLFHQTQNMGRWIDAGTERNWPLHLADTRVEGPDNSLCSGLAHNLKTLAGWVEAPELEDTLGAADACINDAFQAFPDFDAVASSAARALVCVRQGMAICPAHAADEVLHRLARKQEQLSTVIRLASGVRIDARLSKEFWRPGDSSPITVQIYKAGTVAKAEVNVWAQAPWSEEGGILSLALGAHHSNPYPDTYLPEQPDSPAIELKLEIEGITSTTRLPLEVPPVILPAATVEASPLQRLVNINEPIESFDVRISNCVPHSAAVTLSLPKQWTMTADSRGLSVTPPDRLDPGLYQIAMALDKQPAHTTTTIAYPHIETRAISTPATLQVRAIDIQIPATRIAYIGGGSDTVDDWLKAMGLCVTIVEDEQIKDAGQLASLLSSVDTLVVGLFAYRMRPLLSQQTERINQWVNDGGHLLTLYHRPWDNWNPAQVPPRHLEIGQPSLRYRVTDQNAVVTHLAPTHPLLLYPNKIDQADWQGWHKERGLYFAKSWDASYTALLSMADPGEDPHTGALLSAQVGMGRHTHTALILHHQMNKLVPGSFRLMANLVNGAQVPQ